MEVAPKFEIAAIFLKAVPRVGYLRFARKMPATCWSSAHTATKNTAVSAKSPVP